MKALIATTFALVIVAGCKPSEPPRSPNPEPFASGDQLIQAMHDRYAGRWYRTLTFVQSTTRFAPDGTERNEIWYEAALLPSRLRIDFDPLSAGNGVLVRGDSQYVMQRGNVARVVPRANELLLLGFDIYHLEPASSSSWLHRLGFDMSKIRIDSWQGREVYVVGANDVADLKSKQFWIDRENLIFVRLLQPAGPNNARTDDIRFGKYERIGRAWVAPYVEIFSDGKLVMKEEYRHVRIDQPLDSALFVPATWTSARHWYQP